MGGTTHPRSVEVSSDVGALATRVAEVFTETIDGCVARRGRCTVALSRPTPADVFRAVNEIRLPRGRLDVFQVDERVAKRGTDDRNLTLIERDLHRWADASTVHAMDVDGTATPMQAAARYEDELIDVCGDPPELDLVHLGLGPDGHTASLVPADRVLDVRDRWVWFAEPHGDHDRVTLTYETLDAARLIVFVVSGAAKAEALRGVLNGDHSLPAARLQNGNVRFYVDAEAASLL